MRVAGLLWPDSSDDRALMSLDRAVLETERHCPELLRADHLGVWLDPDVEVDVDELRRTAAATEDALAEGSAGALLGRLVGEPLLPDWYDEWVLPERERLERLRARALARVARYALEAGDLALGVDAASAATHADPLLESAAELAIRAHLGRGDPGSALLEFDRHCDAVREEFGVLPSSAVLELIESAFAESRTAADRPGGENPEFAALVDPELPTSDLPEAETAGRPGEPVGSTGGRGRAKTVRLLGAVALLLAASLTVLTVLAVSLTPGDGDNGADDGAGRDTGASATPVHPQTKVLPAAHVSRKSTMLVRVVGAAGGRAAFLVRTATRPALVRLELRGDDGRTIVRRVWVRSSEGRPLTLGGLRPGTYLWRATSPVASTVRGRLRVPSPPVAVPVDARAGTTIEAAGSPSGARSAPATPVSTVSTTPAAPAPPSSGGSSQPHPSSRPHPAGQPKDPGTRPPPPVG
ncbi:BTAD domain-containing putative transcriptional regulator [Nocardioides sp. CER19]|uniref:BTAD domain-containing putative transcriptional regulator n=1 Tax=Nocardioides sp. CER19 TaxID=3038538 RepID=UPI00244D0A1D|nr:BTAD domain-containing putative transcriptional regulator [Nocardioides sp. CER19]MDH2414734.1 BTAD domain-containing putative transcriptional regulator [Nocardioides sp. CER19]